jgi:hypothetical protein
VDLLVLLEHPAHRFAGGRDDLDDLPAIGGEEVPVDERLEHAVVPGGADVALGTEDRDGLADLGLPDLGLEEDQGNQLQEGTDATTRADHEPIRLLDHGREADPEGAEGPVDLGGDELVAVDALGEELVAGDSRKGVSGRLPTGVGSTASRSLHAHATVCAGDDVDILLREELADPQHVVVHELAKLAGTGTETSDGLGHCAPPVRGDSAREPTFKIKENVKNLSKQKTLARYWLNVNITKYA